MTRHHRHLHEPEAVRYALLLLIGLFVLLRISDIFMYWVSLTAIYPVPGIRSNVIISVLWTTVFLVLLAMRRVWARYVLIIFTGYIALLSFICVSMMFVVQNIEIWPSVAIAAWFAAYFTAAMTLIRSRNIYRLAKHM